MRMDEGPHPLPLHPDGTRIVWEKATDEQRAMITAHWDWIESPNTDEKEEKASKKAEKKALKRRFQ